jgi:hypothetical protein
MKQLAAGLCVIYQERRCYEGVDLAVSNWAATTGVRCAIVPIDLSHSLFNYSVLV